MNFGGDRTKDYLNSLIESIVTDAVDILFELVRLTS